MIGSKEQMLFSVSAVRRFMGISERVRVQIKVWWKVVWVWVEGKRPTFISQRVFKQHFIDWRKAKARALQAFQHIDNKSAFTVWNETKNTRYTVQCMPYELVCECDDYSNQKRFIGIACCKHSYAVLNVLGFNSLRHYIEAASHGA